jgi:hypothetical protein
MTEIKVNDWMPAEMLEVVRSLRQQGYVLGEDFEFEYHRPKYDETTYEAVYNRHTIFRFYKDELATWFSLRYL